MLFNNTNMRTAMAYTNAVGDKVYPIIVDIKKGIKSTEEVSFVSSDINTGVLSVAFIQGNDTYNVEGAEVICSIMRPDTTTLEIPCNAVNDNIVEVPLGVNGTSQDGVYSFDFKVFKGEDKIVGTPIMNYSVSLSISNDLVVEEDDRLPVLTMLITQVNELKEETRETINQANVATEASKEATANAIEATNNANAVSERVSQETSEAISRVDNTIVELNNTVSEKVSELDNAKSDMTTTVSNKVNEVETRFNALTASQQQASEVIDARDGETSLKARLDRDIEKAKQVYVELEGNHISTESSTGAIQDIEILGNTVQNPNNLADIKSVGELQEDGTYKMSILSTNGLDKGNQSYQENKCDILLPCQLEKVGDVSDRLYYDDVEKAWCIEKQVTTYTITGDEAWQNGSIKNGLYSSWCDNIINNRISTNKICYTSVKYVNTTEEYNSSEEPCCLLYTNGVNIKVDAIDLVSFKNKVKGMKLTYLAKTPQKIVLPLDVQIQLNSFFGTTHVYMESGEVEGTIKCKIPKSLGATVQSLNNKTDILSDRIEAIEGLKDSQNMKYETDKGYLVCKETKNGVIDDLKIEGKTLVNLSNLPGGDITITRDVDVCKIKPLKQLTSSDVVYLSFYCKSLTCDYQMGVIYDIEYTDDTPTEYKLVPNDTTVGYKQVKIVPKSNVKSIGIELHSNNSVDSTATISDIMLMYEKDYNTQNPPSYFEGLKSVGQDVDEIEVLSCNENLVLNCSFHEQNQFNYAIRINDIKTKNLRVSNPFGKKIALVIFNYNTNSWVRDIEVLPNTFINTELNLEECVRFINFPKVVWDGNNDYVSLAKHVIIGTDILNIDKKQILFYNENGELEPIQELHEWDSIEKHSDNKWYYHKRSGKVVLNGSEKIIIYRTHNNVISFNINIEDSIANKNTDYFISDKINFNKYCYDLDVEGIAFSPYVNKNIYFNILKSKLSTQDLEGFKQWLQANNVTVVYQLAEEEVYELAPLHLDSYANETLILCNSGAISPKMEFSITSHINELVKSQGDRISLLEEKMYKALKQVLAGDMYSLAELLYPEDFVEENPENEIMLL